VTATRTVALNPVLARLVSRAEDWRSSSGAAHLAGRDDGLVSVAPLLDRSAGRFADPDLNRDGAVGLRRCDANARAIGEVISRLGSDEDENIRFNQNGFGVQLKCFFRRALANRFAFVRA